MTLPSLVHYASQSLPLFLLNLFWNPNLCFARIDSKASLCQHTILFFKCSSLAFLWVQKNLAADATGTWMYHTWAITPCDPALFSTAHRAAAQDQAETSSHTWKKTTRLESPNCRLKPGHKTEDAFRASLYKLLLSAGNSRTAGHKTSYQVTTYRK